jgi:hypothetical protein
VTLTDAALERFSDRLTRHLSALATLAWPVMLSRAGILLMALVDVVMLGRYGVLPLAEASLALGLFIPVMVTCVGLQMGLISIVARRHGAGREDECVAAWRRALPWATLTTGAGMALFWQAEAILLLIGQEPALAAGAGDVAQVLAPGLLLQVLYVTCAFYLEGTGRPKPALAAMVAGEPAERRAQLAVHLRQSRRAGARRGGLGAGDDAGAAVPVRGAAGLHSALPESARRQAARSSAAGSGGRAAGRRGRRCAGSASPRGCRCSSRPRPSAR